MPDRHGPLKVVYESRAGGESWQAFEEGTPNDVLDRTTRGILLTDPEWLGSQLTPVEIAAVEEYFDVSIGGGGAAPDPASRFTVETFEGSANPVDGGVSSVFFMITVADADDDDDVTGFRVDATSDDGETDEFVSPSEGPGSGVAERSNFEVGLFTERTVDPPVTVTLSAADLDSGESFVELATTTVNLPEPT